MCGLFNQFKFLKYSYFLKYNVWRWKKKKIIVSELTKINFIDCIQFNCIDHKINEPFNCKRKMNWNRKYNLETSLITSTYTYTDSEIN